MQGLHRNGLGLTLSGRPLAIEVATVAHERMVVTERHVQFLGQHLGVLGCGARTMNVLMRIDVSRVAPQQLLEKLELPVDFSSDGMAIFERRSNILFAPLTISKGPFAQIQVQTDAQIRMQACELNRVSDSVAQHHQAGTGDNALRVRGNNSAIDARGQTKVVGIYDQYDGCVHATVARQLMWFSNRESTLSESKNSVANCRAQRE